MFHVIFEASPDGPRVEVQARPGEALVDLCDANAAPVPFSCRGASCATCRVAVLEGAEHLAAPNDSELDLLEMMGDDPKRYRLACQAALGASAAGGTVRLKAAFEP